MCVEEGVHDFFGGVERGYFAAEAQNIGVIVAAGDGGHLCVENLGGPDTGDLVCCHAHADAGGAEEQSQLGAMADDGFGDSRGVIGIVGGRGRARSIITRADALGGEVGLDGFLQFVTTVVRAQREHDSRTISGTRRRGFAMVNKAQERRDPLLDLVAGVHVDLVGAADRITDVLFEHVERVVEFAEEKGFFGRLGIEKEHRVHMAMGHAEDVIGFLHDIGGELAAALPGNVDAQFLDCLDGVGAGWLAFDGADAG